MTQVGNLRGDSPIRDGLGGVVLSAECHSAIRQIANLRYEAVSSILGTHQ